MLLSVREIREDDVKLIAAYWSNSDTNYLTSLGVDINKLPPKEAFEAMLLSQLALPIEKRRSYCIIWELNNVPIGHCNTNPTAYGASAYMHLHIWQEKNRNKGTGAKLLQMTLPYFFNRLLINTLFCQPYAINQGVHKTLEKAGFEFAKEDITIPGNINFEQPVKLWQLTAAKYHHLYE